MDVGAHTGDVAMRELDVETCMGLLGEHRFGRVAFDDGAGPVILPVNYVFHQGSVLFRSDLGSKVAAAYDHVPASFEIDHVDEVDRVGWSVVVRGRLAEVLEQRDFDEVATAGVDPFVIGGGKTHHVRLEQRSISGRVTHIPESVSDGWYRAAVLGTFLIDDTGDV